jgi:hypothetical protein
MSDDGRSEQRHDEEEVAEEEAEAAAEAGRIGGSIPPDSDDPAQQALIESGQGESEGFELAEKRLEEVASHGDQHRFPDRDVPGSEEQDADYGEPDEEIPADE